VADQGWAAPTSFDSSTPKFARVCDIGTCLPIQGNVREVAREVIPDARVVYADAEDPIGIVARLREAMAPGSYLVVSHSSAEGLAEVSARVGAVLGRAAPFVPRTGAEVLRFFDCVGRKR
jgi:hypothetical protein